MSSSPKYLFFLHALRIKCFTNSYTLVNPTTLTSSTLLKGDWYVLVHYGTPGRRVQRVFMYQCHIKRILMWDRSMTGQASVAWPTRHEFLLTLHAETQPSLCVYEHFKPSVILNLIQWLLTSFIVPDRHVHPLFTFSATCPTDM